MNHGYDSRSGHADAMFCLLLGQLANHLRVLGDDVPRLAHIPDAGDRLLQPFRRRQPGAFDAKSKIAA